MTERIGVLLVHGIGKQMPNEHLIGEARNIVAALGEEVASISVTAEARIATEVPDRFVADFDRNIVRVEVTTDNHTRLQIEFNEVYWADLGEEPTLPRQIRFWFWALSMWTVAGREYSKLVGFQKMYVPRGGHLKWLDRPVLAFFGALFLLGAGTIGLLNLVLDRVKLPRVPISDLLTAYVGDVMLYSQPRREEDPIVAEVGEPPRADIRGRMVDAMVEFAMRDYSRWYILAHSLGTVAAYNGLMETEDALPNYLSKERWQRLKAACPSLTKTLKEPVQGVMLPRRPAWLDPKDGIDRERLFAKLHGFLTYGSAIGKFHAIWPIMVPANKDEYVFAEKFKWYNIYEPTDPVAGPLDAFHRRGGVWDNEHNRQATSVSGLPSSTRKSAAKIDESVAYSAGWMWLLSHLQYLAYPPRGFVSPPHRLVFEVALWLRDGCFNIEGLKSTAPWAPGRVVLRLGEPLILAILVWLSTAAVLVGVADWLGHIAWIHWLADGRLPYWALSAALVVALVEMAFIPLLSMWLGSDPPHSWRWAIVVIAIGLVLMVEPYVSNFALLLAPHMTAIEASIADYFSGSWLYLAVTAVMERISILVGGHTAIGLLAVTLLIITVLGALRWLFQPLPQQDPEGPRKSGAATVRSFVTKAVRRRNR